MGTPFALLLTALVLLAPRAGVPLDPADLGALRAGHAAELLELSSTAVDRGLFDEGERLALEAAEAGAGIDVSGRVRDIAARRRSSSTDEASRAERRAYLESSGCSADREQLAREQAARERARVRELVELVEALEDSATRAEERDAAARWALDLDPEGKPLARALGRERHAALVADRDAARSLARLEFGEVVRGAPCGPEHVAGKVVVWRSFSL